MTPEAILAAITALSNAAAEVAKFCQTPEGQALLKQAREDRAAFERFWAGAGKWVERFLRGELAGAPK